MMRVPRDLDSFFTTVQSLSNFFDVSSISVEVSLVLCSHVESDRYSFIIIYNQPITRQNDNRIQESKFTWKLTCLSSLFSAFVQTRRCFTCTFFHFFPYPPLLYFLGSTTLFGRPSASLEFRHSLVPYLFAYWISVYLSVQDTTPEGILSQCWCNEKSDQSRSSQGYIAQYGCHERSDQSRSSQRYMA